MGLYYGDMIYRGFHATRGWVFGFFSCDRVANFKPSIVVSTLTGYPREEILEVDPASVCKYIGYVAKESYRGDHLFDRMVFTSDIVEYKNYTLYITFEDYDGNELPILTKSNGIYRVNTTEESQYVARENKDTIILIAGEEFEEHAKIVKTRYEAQDL